MSDIQKGYITWIPNLTLRLTMNCNLKCLNCNYWKQKQVFFSLEKLKAIIVELKELGVKEILLIGGEPTIHPEFIQIIELLNAYSFKVVLFSNLFTITNKHINAINKNVRVLITSLDSYEDSKHDKIRGVNGAFKSCINALSLIDKEGTYLAANSVISSETYNNSFIDNMVCMCKEKEIKYLSFSLLDKNNALLKKPNLASCISLYDKKMLLSLSKKVNALNIISNELIIKTNPLILEDTISLESNISNILKGFYGTPFYLNNNCWESFNGINILPNGDVYPCLHTICNKTFIMGNIFNDRLGMIINSPKANFYRSSRLKKPFRHCLLCKDYQEKNLKLSRLLTHYE